MVLFYTYVWLTNICISTVICDRTWIRARMIYRLYITGYGCMILINLGPDSEQVQVTLNMVINFRAWLTDWEFSEHLWDCSLLMKNSTSMYNQKK